MATPSARYTSGAIVLHWLIAALLITNIGLAWWFNTLHGAAVAAPMGLHKSIGISILLLSLARLGWRLVNPPPPLPPRMPAWERWASLAVHILFYAVMIGMPLSGWALVSAGPKILQSPLVLFNAIPWPAIGPLTSLPADQVKPAHHLFALTHGLLAKLAYVLIVLHVGAALKHQFLDRDQVVARMAPSIAPQTR